MFASRTETEGLLRETGKLKPFQFSWCMLACELKTCG